MASSKVSPAGAALSPAIPAKARLHVVTGKGGTGKTTVAVALAIALAQGGRKVLVVEVEGRQALAQVFDVAALPYEERKLISLPGNGSLWGLAIDAEQAMIEYLDMFYGLKRSARGLKRMGAVDFVTTLAPGLRDVLLTGKVKESVTRTEADGHHAYDYIVLDAPPTGRITKFLDATKEVASLTKFGPINRQSDGVIQVLHGPQTSVHIVTLLEEMPVQETIDAVGDLTASGFQLGTIVVNRARPALISAGLLGADHAVDEKALAAGLKKANLPVNLAAALASEVTEYAERLELQGENAAKLDAIDLPRITLPDLNPPVELGELSELAACFLADPTDLAETGAAGAAV
jgi:anion-transporting  ArsA/GET3 family ATPase